MGRTLVVGDIHGAYKALVQVLERAAIIPDDRFIFLGDYVDGWSESAAVIQTLIELNKTHSCVFLRGNHESLVLDWMQQQHENQQWLSHGGLATIKSYETVSKSEKQEHQSFLEKLNYYHIDAKNRLFVHAGFTNPKGVTAEFYKEYLSWDRSLWEMVLCLDPSITRENPFYPKRLQHYNEIFIGHTPVTYCGGSEPMNRATVWNLDTGAAFKGKVSLMDVDTKKFWQSDCVADLYPNEEGRNGR